MNKAGIIVIFSLLLLLSAIVDQCNGFGGVLPPVNGGKGKKKKESGLPSKNKIDTILL